jgi:hypothetical protein
MKRTFAKRSLMSLVAGFFLFGFMLLSAGRVEAQTIGGEHNWVQSDQAQLSLITTVNGLYNDLATLTPGTPAHNNKLAHAVYYRVINRKIGEGMFVGLAAKDALEIFNGKDGVGAIGSQLDLSGISVDAGLKQQLYNDAVSLLTQ